MGGRDFERDILDVPFSEYIYCPLAAAVLHTPIY